MMIFEGDKSPQVIRKDDHDESMSLTPSTYDGQAHGKSQWGQMTQKSYLTANNASSVMLKDQSVIGGESSANDNGSSNGMRHDNSGVQQNPGNLNKANNRTTTSDNPMLNRLTTNIP